MFRFDSKAGKLMYPVSSNSAENDVTELKLRRDNSIVLMTVPFIIPAYGEETSFELFVKDMENAEDEFLNKLLSEKCFCINSINKAIWKQFPIKKAPLNGGALSHMFLS